MGGDGHTHNIYIGDIADFTLTDSYVHDANIGHEVKSRAENNTITNNVIADNNEHVSLLDRPAERRQCHDHRQHDRTGRRTGRTLTFMAYGEEGDSNPGNQVTFSNNTVVNDSGRGPLWINNGATVTGSGNTVYNLGLNNLGSGIDVSGYTEVSSRPDVSGAGVGVGSGDTPNPNPRSDAGHDAADVDRDRKYIGPDQRDLRHHLRHC